MIVVDTSVWIDHFNAREGAHVDVFAALIRDDAGIALTDVIYTEILQGLRHDRDFHRVQHALHAFDILRLQGLDDFSRAAQLYRQARREGVTIRRTLDCLIASVCIREGLPILHNDADFDRLAGISELRLHKSDDRGV